MGRVLSAGLAAALVCGLSGCLLFTDPINEVPKVKIQRPSGDVVRGQTAQFGLAELSDDRTPVAQLRLEWSDFEVPTEGCDAITDEAWGTVSPTVLNRDETFACAPRQLEVVCVCVRATDLDGAVAQDCARVAPVNSPPVAVLEDVTGIASEAQRPLCANVHLSGETSDFAAEDTLEAQWTLDYAGSDPKGSTITLTDCAATASTAAAAVEADSAAKLHRCFFAKAPGVYTVGLTLAATPPGAGAADTLTGKKAVYVVVVDADRPPYLERTDPDVYAKWIMLERTRDGGRTYETRDFSVLRAPDDCEPFPAPADAPTKGAHFVWSVYDTTQSPPRWVYQATTSNTFTISQASFPSAQPDDLIKVRVEVRDDAVERLYTSGISACADSVDICCDGGACSADNHRVRWTTWTVQFLLP